MPCYHPIPARETDVGPWVLYPELGTADAMVPCMRCLGCRSSRQLDWTHRAVHEARSWRNNRFITLMYDDDHLPAYGELQPGHLTNFLKRLRAARDRATHDITSNRSASIRYLACGEYGETTLRPHYHLCLFNAAFADERPYSEKLSSSGALDDLWTHGATKLAPFTAATAGYVAGYLTKRGRDTYVDRETGLELQRPFQRQSSRPALGRNWLEKNYDDLKLGFIVQPGGKKARIPRYYIKWLLEKNETTNARVHESRARNEAQRPSEPSLNNTHPDRLKAAETTHRQKVLQKLRDFR